MSDSTRGEGFVIQGEARAEKPIEFSTFLLGLASSALIHLGDAPHPETGTPQKDLVLARQSVDLLTLLREKTQGNLTPEEDRFFDNLLADLRLRFVEASKSSKP
jgi:hypothetical protein